MPLFHLYTDTSDIPRKLHWDPEDDQKRAIKWTELDHKSLNRLNDLFAGKVEEPMNLGDEAIFRRLCFDQRHRFKK